MLNFDFATDRDRREAAAVERRRSLDEERKKRIFNPRSRFSVDKDALEAQIREKRKAEQEEKQRDYQYEQLQQQYIVRAKELEEKEKAERLKLEKEINEFRFNYQRVEDRREYDLYDPKGKYPFPARLYDDDPRCGISSMQKFEGEDLYSKEREALQNEQLRAWLDQQIMEKEAAEKDRIDAENAYKSAMMARDQRALELSKLEEECRTRLEVACLNYNRALADERRIRKEQKAKEDAQDSMAHKYNVLMSDIMTEDVECTSSLGPNRKVTTQFKGMPASAREELMLKLQSQMDEVKDKKMKEKRFDVEWNEYINGLQQTMAAMDQELARKQRDLNKKIAEENLKLSIEQKNHQEFLNKIVYTNKPTAAYYEQFNKTAR